jgi:hypothetical protein
MKHSVKMRVWIEKRVVPILISLVLLLAISPRALAAGRGKPIGKPGKPDATQTSKPETPQAGKPKEKGTDAPGKATPNPEETTAKIYTGISVDKIANAIESVTDSEQQSELTNLLDAYKATLDDKSSALTGKTGSMSELSQAASDARKALKDGLKEAGFTLGSVLGWQEWKQYQNTESNLQSIADAIAALEDTDANKALLSDLLKAYQNALTAEAAATEENKEALAEATNAAHEALFEALFLAGLLPMEEPALDTETALPE